MVDRCACGIFLGLYTGADDRLCHWGNLPHGPGRRKGPALRYLPLEGDYLLSPLPNLYFSRDPAVAVGSSLILCAMQTAARQRKGC